MAFLVNGCRTLIDWGRMDVLISTEYIEQGLSVAIEKSIHGPQVNVL